MLQPDTEAIVRRILQASSVRLRERRSCIIEGLDHLVMFLVSHGGEEDVFWLMTQVMEDSNRELFLGSGRYLIEGGIL